MYVWQRGRGETLVLIHGMFGDHLDWEPVLEPLARTRRLIVPDLPGFGASPKPRVEYTPEVFLAALREAVGGERVSLVGNSFGGQIAILYAMAYPDQVSELVLVDSGGFSDYSQAEKDFLIDRLSERAILDFTPAIVRALFERIYVTLNADAHRYVEKQIAKLAWPDYAAYAAALASCIRLSVNTCFLDRLDRVQCPVRMIWGECDRVAPVELARRAAPLFPDARLHVIPECGHVPQIEKPDIFLELLR